ncbi:metallophosphoesterase [Marinobacterium sp. AK62]|uniref:Metallophosphoesterase n=1 Tax=Marinobacterium alkalitolerans TaxID=1542925 RepID=A0ABS3Z6C7_9GAMM|nr:metallophosphoesterase [Marinobacterium alkalitolerans]MBP0047254.1 metallophosphoesterase [Marinobacterium alkalitolerans]
MPRPALPTIKSRPEHADIRARLPLTCCDWPLEKGSADSSLRNLTSPSANLQLDDDWHWPRRPVIFISDPHADPQAFEASLVASGGVKLKDTAGSGHFTLTKAGRKAEFIIGGDCLDKGPSNLQMLRSLKRLYDTGASVTLLAGNHDLRLMMGLRSMQQKRHTGNAHLFARMGKKVIPLFREVLDAEPGRNWLKGVPDADTCRKRLLPGEDWFERFPDHARGILTEAGIARELKKMRSKADSFERHCEAAGMDIRTVYAVARHCQKLFLKPRGEFYWFFKRMQLVRKRGSFLFLHAGLDDAMGALIARRGLKTVNKRFRKALKGDLFSFYYSSLANTFRTKYRAADLPLTEAGVEAVQSSGIRALVHGHINRTRGQRLALQQGLLHLEADITLDRHSRRQEGLRGVGCGATIIHPKRHILGISNDYPFAKVFRPETFNAAR